jgi:hypothetical protein
MQSHRLGAATLLAGLILSLIVVTGCEGPSSPSSEANATPTTVAEATTPTSAPSAATSLPASTDTTFPEPVNGGPGTPEYDGIPHPIVQGWYRYVGEGRFVTPSGSEYFWNNGRFVNPDGTLLQIPDALKESRSSMGVTRQPTIPDTLTPEKAALADEIERIRKGLLAGTQLLEWNPPSDSDLPADPLELLESLEDAAYAADASVYLAESAGTADRFRSELDAMSEVQETFFYSRERALQRLQWEFEDSPPVVEGLGEGPLPAYVDIWLKDRSQTAAFAAKLEERPEVDDAQTHSIDFAYWTQFLHSRTREK